MTVSSSFGLVPPTWGDNTAPHSLDLSHVSIVVPAKDNQQGIERLLMACLQVFSPRHSPKEIIVVDNRSRPALVPPVWASWLPLRLLICSRPGPAAARNVGARAATGEWLLFLDSDCLPTAQLIEGYQQALNGAVGYAGAVQADGYDLLSRYYDMQCILTPPPLLSSRGERPNFLIAANALIWRRAFLQVGGFDERFHEAEGEDIDLSLHLWGFGPLSYASQALVTHTFEPSLVAFLRRFAGSGRAHRKLASIYHVDLTPHPFTPLVETASFRFLATLQFLALRWGYATARPMHMPSSYTAHTPWLEEARGEQKTAAYSSADIALFIDGDNISAELFVRIWQTVTQWGPVRFCGVYCQRSSPKWEQVRKSYPLITICGQTGEETDSLLIQDAETWARTSSVRRFCLVSNDGDFASAVLRLKQAGEVIGIGMPNASNRLKQACSRFIPILPPKK